MFKKLSMILFSGIVVLCLNNSVYAEEEYPEEFIEETVEEFAEDPVVEPQDLDMSDQVAAKALDDYEVEGSLFEKITMLEQEKVVIQLEKERAQLDLELERLNAERIKLQMELDTLSGRADQQQRELETAKAQLEIQTEKLRRQKDMVDEEFAEVVVERRPQPKETEVSKKYKLVNVVGVGNQLQATIEEVSTGQNKRISVGKELDGYVVKSISLNDGIIFEKDGTEESLNIGK